jgi:N-methylhydantoinase B/oxoprolinase/acetone carboxylase alpha subunit
MEGLMSTDTSGSSSADALLVEDPFLDEILRNAFLSMVREMISVTVRSAYSTCLSEGLDFTCGLFDAGGRLFAQAGGVPIHIGALDVELQAVLAAVGDVDPGDVLLHNDPFEGADHQSDVIVAVPMHCDGQLLGFSVNRAHWSDIGAMFAGGYGLAMHTVQEGLVIPPCKLIRRGEVSREVREFILRNVRMPQQVWGDIQAQIASARVAADRFGELVGRYGVPRVQRAVEHSLEYAARRFRERLSRVPDGVFSAEDVLDDDGFGRGPFAIRVQVTKHAEGVIVDFAGSAPQTAGAANCTIAGTKAAAYTALKAIVDPEIPFNSAVSDLIEVRAPLGTVVNPRWPAPVCCAPAEPTIRICETVLRCFVDVIPEQAVAGSYSSGLNTPGWGRDPHGEEFMWYVLGGGGCGARLTRDGHTVQWHTMAMCSNESIEAWEARYPVRFERRALRPDSAGAGRTRGGLGDERVITCLVDTWVSGYLDRSSSQPWGAHGGEPGAPNQYMVGRDGREMTLTEVGATSDAKFSNLLLRAGDRLVVRSGGGGGFGPPRERDPKRVRDDVRAGYVSAAAARERYGVVIDDDGAIDRQGTSALRAR